MTQSRRYLLFSSVGDSYNKAIESWSHSPFKTERLFDIVFAYYGDDPARFAWLSSYCDHIYWGKGSKFQNFIRLYHHLHFARYSYIWVPDDDIALSLDQVASLFQLTEQYDLAVSQPSLSRYGVISYPIQIPQLKNCLLRYTNFVEVTCPVLSHRASALLVSIVEPYSDRLTCHGLDIIMSHYIHGPSNRFAIIDAVTTRNPYPLEKKGGYRECLRMADVYSLRRNWETVRKLLPLPIPPVDPEIFEYESVLSNGHSIIC
jgi:hypothetical protein